MYDSIWEAKDHFAGGTTGVGGFLGGPGDPQQEVREFHESLRQQLPSHARSRSVNSLVEALFPKVAAAFGAPNPGSYLEDEWRRQLRVCSTDSFDTYFRFGVGRDDVSPIGLPGALSGDEPGWLSQFLLRLAHSEKPEKAQLAVDGLVDFAAPDELHPDAARRVAAELLEVGDELLRSVPEPVGVFEFGIDVSLGRLMRRLLQGLAPDDRLAVLRDGVARGEALSFIIREISILGSERDPGASVREDDQLLTSAQAEELRSLAVQRLETEAAQGNLIERPRLPYILYRWSEWGGSDAVRTWMHVSPRPLVC